MVKQISDDWWMLSTSFNERPMVFFATTEEHVLAKYKSYLRSIELQLLEERLCTQSLNLKCASYG